MWEILPFLFTSIISIAVWLCFFVVLSDISIFPFGGVLWSFSRTVIYGAIAGILYALLIKLIVWKLGDDVFIINVIATLGATEIFLLIPVFGIYTELSKSSANNSGLLNYIFYHLKFFLSSVFLVLIPWYIILSLILFIPTLVLGTIIGIVSHFVNFYVK